MDRFVVLAPMDETLDYENYRAMVCSSGEVVILRKFSLDSEGRIPKHVIRSANVLFEIQHKNIIRFYGVFTHEGDVYLILEHLARSLMSHINDADAMTPLKIKVYLKQLLSGVSHLHSRGIIHRNLKPENLFIDPDDTLKIGNFEVSRGFFPPRAALSPEVTTLRYSAPETLLGDRCYSSPVDMWSVGCIFAEMVTKVCFFGGTTNSEVLHSIFSKLGSVCRKTWILSYFSNLENSFAPHAELRTFVPGLEASGVDLLSKLLCLDSDQRITASEALHHKFLDLV